MSYALSTEVLAANGRYKIAEGASKNEKHVICCCKPSSALENESLCQVGVLVECEDGVMELGLLNTDVKFFGDAGSLDLAGIMEVVSAIYGEPRNMLIDVQTNPVIITGKTYQLASEHGLFAERDTVEVTKKPEPEEPAKTPDKSKDKSKAGKSGKADDDKLEDHRKADILTQKDIDGATEIFG